jgi:hypothetical protein
MTLLAASCGSDSLARVEVRDGLGRSVLDVTGTGTVDVPQGLYELRAQARGRLATRVVAVRDAATQASVDLGRYPSAAPTLRSTTYDPAVVQLLDQQLTGAEPAFGAGLVAVVLRTGAGADVRGADHTLELDGLDVEWQSVDRLRWMLTQARPGLVVGRTRHTDPSAMAVPVWAGWQTLVFVPVIAGRPALGEAAVHCIPARTRWSDAASANELTEQLIGALEDRQRSVPDVDRTEVAAALELQTPLHALLAGDLARLERFEVGGEVTAADRAALLAIGEVAEQPEALGRVDSRPVLDASVDELLRYEALAPWSLGGDLASACTTRLASEVWFRWRPDDERPAPTIDAGAWKEAVERFVRSNPDSRWLRRYASRRRTSAAAARLAFHLADRAEVRDITPAEVLDQPVGDLVLTTGLPAAALHVAAIPAIAARRRRRWFRTLAATAVVVVAVALALILLHPWDRPPDTIPITTTIPPTTAPEPIPTRPTQPTTSTSSTTSSTTTSTSKTSTTSTSTTSTTTNVVDIIGNPGLQTPP